MLEAAGNDRDKAIVLFLLDSGCRSCELVSLNGADIDTQSGEVRIRQGKPDQEESEPRRATDVDKLSVVRVE